MLHKINDVMFTFVINKSKMFALPPSLGEAVVVFGLTPHWRKGKGSSTSRVPSLDLTYL